MNDPTKPNRTFSTRLHGSISNTTKALVAGVAPNPFGNSVQFTEVAYLDQLNHQNPPTVPVSGFFPSVIDVANNGITIELWFKAGSSGSLVSVPMSTAGQTAAIAPLIYLDSNGLLRGGLFDSTQITLLSQQNLIASQDANQVITVGALNGLKSPLAGVDGQWHHAALVVQPGAKGTQNLFLDGRLADSGTANGSFGLSFVASDGTTWTADTSMTTPFGGPITPEPQVPPSPNFMAYAQGFCGCLNELRTWNGPRSVTQIQQLIDQPLGSDLSTYQQQGLVGYVGSSQLETAVQPGTYLSLTGDAPPFDPFTEVSNRVPGFQHYGICTAIPFTTAAPEIMFEPSQTYSTKISLCQADQLQVSFPKIDANGDNLMGTFSMMVTGGASGEIQDIDQIAPGSVFTISAPLTDCYRFDFTYTTTTNCTIDNLQFMLVPGPLNTLMQLLLDVLPFQAAYTDPNYPITETTLPDPRNPNPSPPNPNPPTVTLPPYWPLFTDQTVFPIDNNNYSASDLLTAYLNLNEAARKLSLKSGPTFNDFFNLSANQATADVVGDLSTLLQNAYAKVTGGNPPATVPTKPFKSPVDQVYAFIYNVNAMRQTLYEFLSAYNGWVQIAMNELALANIPSSIANQIYNAQEQVEVSLKGPSKGEFIANLIIGSVLWGLGAVAGPLLLPAAVAATVSATTIAYAFVGSAGANLLSELLGTFLGSVNVQGNLSEVNYTTLEDVVNNVNENISSDYNTLIGNLLDPQYLQTLYSNYGLLQALSFVNAQPLYDANQKAISPGANNSLVIGTTYASWKALIPSVFTWTPQLLTGQNLTNNNVVFMVTNGPSLPLTYGTIPSSLSVSVILQNDPWKAYYWMLHQIQAWQTGTKSSPSGGQFFSVCPIFYYSDQAGMFEYTADWVVAWTLKDSNQHAISSDLVASLFGIGNSSGQVNLADQNNPLAAAGYGWYCQIANGAVTTPFDAFMNWGEGVSSYSPQMLLAQYMENGNLYDAFAVESDVGVKFGAAAAADMPPPALVTLEPSAMSFGAIEIGATSQPLSAVLTNSQQNDLQNISATSDSSAFVVSAPADVPAGKPGTITVSFVPGASDGGQQSGKITITTQGQYGPISLTLECSGTGVEPS